MPRKRSTPGIGARDQMLESAIFLMRQSGLSGAGINQILDHSQAPKGSMYYYFPNGKLQITQEALERYGARVAAAIEAALSSREMPGEKIGALFRSIATRFEEARFDQSCAVGAVALDLNTDVADLRPVVAGIMASWRAVIARHLPFRSRAQRDSFAGLVLSAIEGGYVRGRVERSAAPLLEAGNWIGRLVSSKTRSR